jgi:hypothetical protein
MILGTSGDTLQVFFKAEGDSGTGTFTPVWANFNVYQIE